jgi:glycosyltransferase involved in cell wall biosynthesis
MKKKIGLFLAGAPQGGGKFQYNATILEALAALPKDRYDMVVGYWEDYWTAYLDRYDLSRFKVRPGFWSRALFKVWRRSGLPIAWWRTLNPWFHPVSGQLLGQHCHLWIFPSEDSWAYQIRLPALAAIHDLMHRYERRFPEVSAHGEYERREKDYINICRWAAGVLVDSEVGKKLLVESYGINPGSVHVLPYVAPKHIYDQDHEGTSLSSYRLPEKFFFYPAQFWEHKNHQSLMRAIALLQDKHPDIQMVFTGSPKNAYESVRALVENLGLQDKVHFLGYVPDAVMAKIYRRARALVMPTFCGFTDIPPLEASALGCPVGLSDIYGMREQMGDAALYFDPSSLPEIARVMEMLWTDDALCRDLSRRGLIRAGQWTPAHFNERLKSIVEKILN